MFANTLLDSSPARPPLLKRVRRALAVGAGIAAEAVLVAVLVVIPLIRVEALPKLTVFDRIPVPPSRGHASSPPRTVEARHEPRATAQQVLQTPVRIPQTVPHLVDVPQPPQAESVLNSGGFPGGLDTGTNDGILTPFANPASVPPPPPSPARVTRVRRGSNVQAALLVFGPKPDYPPLARMARIAGEVHLEAVISTDGAIERLRAVSGPPLLVPAALAVVARWRYQPTLLNGQPVEVDTEVIVKFILGN